MKLSRVHGLEWVLGLAGLAILIGLFLPWSDGESGFGSFNLLLLLLATAGVAALLVPLVVSVSRLTDVPIVWETLLWVVALPLLLAFVVAAFLTPPAIDYGAGLWLAFAGLVVIGFAGWRSVRREY